MKHSISIYLKGFLFGILVILFPKLIETVAGTNVLFAYLFAFGGYMGLIVLYVIASPIILYLLSTIPLENFISNQNQFLSRTNIVRFNFKLATAINLGIINGMALWRIISFMQETYLKHSIWSGLGFASFGQFLRLTKELSDASYRSYTVDLIQPETLGLIIVFSIYLLFLTVGFMKQKKSQTGN